MLTETQLEPATLDDLPELTGLLFELFTREKDFEANRDKQLRGLRLILEQPSRGRIFVVRNHGRILGMVNLLFTISTAEGGFVILLEDLVVAPDFRHMGIGNVLIEHAIAYAKEKQFLRITLLTDNSDHESVGFFKKHGFRLSDMATMRLYLPGNAAGLEAPI